MAGSSFWKTGSQKGSRDCGGWAVPIARERSSASSDAFARTARYGRIQLFARGRYLRAWTAGQSRASFRDALREHAHFGAADVREHFSGRARTRAGARPGGLRPSVGRSLGQRRIDERGPLLRARRLAYSWLGRVW